MRQIRYRVAMSLDGYIAGPNGEYDWIIMDPDIDFAVTWRAFDAILLGRKTFDLMARAGNSVMPGVKTYVVSRTLKQDQYPNVTIVGREVEEKIASMRRGASKDIWLFGGGELFRSLLNAGLVDTVEVSVIPVLLGAGTPLLPGGANQQKLRLAEHQVYKTGIVGLAYQVV